MKIIVGRPINGISLNGLEYLMDGDTEREFNSIEEAKEFLHTIGCENYTDDELEDSFMFINLENKEIGTCEYCGETVHENDDKFTFTVDRIEVLFCSKNCKEDYIYELKH